MKNAAVKRRPRSVEGFHLWMRPEGMVGPDATLAAGRTCRGRRSTS